MPPIKALVVDDEQGIARLCQFFLESASYQVATTINPQEAVEFIKQQPFDLLITDIRMPGMDGFELLKIAQKYQPDMAVVFMTAFGTVEIAIQALRFGADGLILKPFSSGSDLLDAANQALLEKARKRDAARLQALNPLFEISEQLISETDTEKLMQLIFGSMQSLFQVQHVGVYQQKADEPWSMIMTTTKPLPWNGQNPNSNFIIEYFKSSQALIVNPGDDVPTNLKKLHEQFSIGSLLVVPLRFKSVNYFVVASRAASSTPFTQADLELFIILTRQCAVALENAQLYNNLRISLKKIEDSQRALVQAEKMAAVGRLMASVAHEVNNPLQSIQNCLALASRNEVTEDEKKEYLGIAQDEINRLSGTLKRMLEFYKPGKSERVDIEVHKMVHAVLHLVSPQLKTKQIKLILEDQAPGIILKGMPDQLQQVIFNLILNASDAVEGNTGSKMIWLTIQKRGDWVVISVEDNGPGIAEGMENHIFEPFVSTKEKGTGLGLAISFSIVEAHGGQLLLGKNEHANGARFEVLISNHDRLS